ncbi:MAG: extracellular solute-binding protein, partial [Elusimicrobia bacterium]|nr:extracellular solute-binding protein [Elusimicrobiota bacterium]
MSVYLDLLISGWMPLLGKSGLVPKNLFDGSCAMQISGRFPRETAAAQNLGVVPIPRVGKTHRTIVSAQHLALLRESPNQEEAWQVLKFLVAPRTQEKYVNAIGAFPCFLEWMEGGGWGQAGIKEVLLKSAEMARPLPALTVLGSLEKIFDRAMENLVRAILHRSYNESLLRQELIHTAAESDYILSLYA